MSDKLAEALARLDDLEVRIAHQDRMTAELNEVITAQWRKITVLERQLAHLREEVQNAGPQREGPEPPPPHY
jgi:SlyX protein